MLRFRTLGVTHVHFLEPAGGVWALFAQQAEHQQYRPRYGLHSGQVPQSAVDLGVIPAGQLVGAAAIVWHPDFDLAERGELEAPAGRAACRSIFDAAGAPPANRVAQGHQNNLL